LPNGIGVVQYSKQLSIDGLSTDGLIGGVEFLKYNNPLSKSKKLKPSG
jgi:hypothetical protein